MINEPIPLEDVECRYIAWATSTVRDDRDILAQQLNLIRRTLFRKLAKCFPQIDSGQEHDQNKSQ